MRILVAVLMMAFSAFVGAQVQAADLPPYPEVQVPEVDYGLQGSFYLRGSVAGNALWTQEHIDLCGCSVPPTAAGYGYSVGAGFGYETGSGLRVDGTLDYLQNDGLTDGTYALHLKGAVALANVYYDFPLGGSGGSAGGGFGAYLGAGAGAVVRTTRAAGEPAVAFGVRRAVALRRHRADVDRVAAAGDAISATLSRPLFDTFNRAMHAGAKVTGRIVRLERQFQPKSAFLIAVAFDTLEDKGVTSPFYAKLIAPPPRAYDSAFEIGRVQSLKLTGQGMENWPYGRFAFPAPKQRRHFIVRAPFQTVWETVSPDPLESNR